MVRTIDQWYDIMVGLEQIYAKIFSAFSSEHFLLGQTLSPFSVCW